eukprot:1394403-Amorphochlora_amoeboformis.AAC.1
MVFFAFPLLFGSHSTFPGEIPSTSRVGGHKNKQSKQEVHHPDSAGARKMISGLTVSEKHTGLRIPQFNPVDLKQLFVDDLFSDSQFVWEVLEVLRWPMLSPGTYTGLSPVFNIF